MDWKPIETAPFDQEIRLRGKGFVSTGVLLPGGGYYLEAFESSGDCLLNREAFEEWMPLLEPDVPATS